MNGDTDREADRPTPAWTIDVPTGSMFRTPKPVPEVRALFQPHRAKLVESGVYSQEEMDAQTSKEADVSWAADEHQMAGPLTTVARVDGRVVAGIELWHQRHDRFWFLEGLIRDQAQEFRGVGIDLFHAVFSWWMQNFGDEGEPLKVHSMVRERDAVRWWTRRIGRPPDFIDAYIESGNYRFEAVGWILARG